MNLYIYGGSHGSHKLRLNGSLQDHLFMLFIIFKAVCIIQHTDCMLGENKSPSQLKQ